jgi:Bacteriophage Mu, Gp27
MARPSSIDRLSAELRELIGDLRERGITIDEILAKLGELGAEVSRSALGRHVKELDQLGERIRRSREIANALAKRLGDAPESRQAQVNIELMHTVVMDLLTPNEQGAVVMDAEQVMLLSRSLQALTSASKSDADQVLKIRREIAAEQKAKLDQMEREAAKAGTSRGFDPETLRRVRTEIYGLPS